ncbi:hypothetical protein CK203_071015 [Vitis vinifera]|uniref:Uncharacterized protein n=1 Tax=Vitis vinifera TaxID=29760 RepID=A0A438E9R5_VITVI|nr:hypothetical protein CK203_071015 [Vitis vinifera]
MPEEEGQSAKLEIKGMDPKRRKTQDFADKADSTATDSGNSGIAESQATDSKAEPVELNAETRKSHYPKLMENRKSTLNGFREHHGLPRRQREQGRLGQQWWSISQSMPLISRATSAHKAWTKLATIYVNQSRTRIMDLKDYLAESSITDLWNMKVSLSSRKALRNSIATNYSHIMTITSFVAIIL